MKRRSYRPRWAIVTCVTLGLMTPIACAGFKDQLLEPQNPGLIDDSAVGSPAAAAALKVGAMGRIKTVYTGSETLWQEAGHLADEYSNADFQPSRNDVDQRTIASSGPDYGNYGGVTVARGYVRDALNAELEFEPTKTADIGELYLAM